MPVPRFRIRTLMVAVAIVAIGTYGVLLIRRSSELRRTARAHRQAAAVCLTMEQKREQDVKRYEIDIVSAKQQMEKDKVEMAREAEIYRALPAGESGSESIPPIPWAQRAEEWKSMIELGRVELEGAKGLLESSQSLLAQESASRRHYERLATNYGRAARRPWLPVPPDPPEPK